MVLAGVSWASEHLLPPWVEKFDPETGKSYYYNTETKKRVDIHDDEDEKPSKEEPKPNPSPLTSIWQNWKSEINSLLG